MKSKKILLNHIDKIHTTKLGIIRIKKNLKISKENVIEYCKEKIKKEQAIVSQKGKNFYVKIDNIIITINSYSYTIITAHLLK